MATIALSGTGTDKKVVLKTVGGVQKVSCSCCGCGSVPNEISVVFSGINVCTNAPSFPGTLSSAVLTRDESGNFLYDDGTHRIGAICWTPNIISQFYPEWIPDIPVNIDPNGSSPIFSIYYYAEDGTGIIFASVFTGQFAANGGSVSNILTASDCDPTTAIRYGGTATISW